MVSKQSAMKRWQSLFARQTYKPSLVDKWNKHDQKLFEAVEKGDAKKVSSLLVKKLIRPTKASPKGQSAFHLAAAKGLTDCLNVIISSKVEINAKTDDGHTALHLAASHCHPDCVKLLLQRGAHEDSINFHSQTPLHCAASSGCVSSILLLCDSEDTYLDAADDDGRTPLMIAAERNHPTVCSLLLDRGAQVDLTDREKKTALILACEKSNIQAAETLISKEADPLLKDNKGCDALSYASLSREETLRKLLQAALDRRKSGEQLHQESASTSKTQQQTSSREQELVNMWKKRYEEEQKRGLWLQGDLMVKTQELENILEESRVERTKLRKMVDELNGLIDGQTEREGATGQEPSDMCGLLLRVVEQAKTTNERRHKERKRQEEKMKMLADRNTAAEQLQAKHQDEIRQYREEAMAAREMEEVSRQRMTELEGHLENMREVLSQFEKRKRIQSTVVEDLQEQISEITQEKEELLVLLKRLQDQEESLDEAKRRNNDQVPVKDNITVLKEFLQNLKRDCTNFQTQQGDTLLGGQASRSYSGFVPLEVLAKNAENWNKTITAMEKHLASIEHAQTNLVFSPSQSPESGLFINGSMDDHLTGPNVMNNPGWLYGQPPSKLETNVPCLQSPFVHRSEDQMTNMHFIAQGASHPTNYPSTQGSKQLSSPTKDNTDSMRQKIADLQVELSTLKVSHDNVLSQMIETTHEKQNLEEGLLALQERLQSEYDWRKEMDAQCKDYKQQVLLLSEELVAEQGKTQKLSARLEAQQAEMLMLRDSFPPEILREESNRRGERFKSDILEELYWNIGTLVMKYTEALQQKTALQKDNQRLVEHQTECIALNEHKNILNELTNKLDMQAKETEVLKQSLFQAMGNVVELKDQLTNQTSNSLSRQEHERKVEDLERVVASLKEESEADREALKKKNEEMVFFKQQLELKTDEEQLMETREAERLRDYERLRNAQEIQVQALREEVQTLSQKLKQASKETSCCQDMLTSETERSTRLEETVKRLEEAAQALRGKTQDYEEQNHRLIEKCDDLSKETQEKHKKMEEALKELDFLAKEIDEQQKKQERLEVQLQDTNKRHQEIISIYRTHLLNAAQGFMDEDVHLTLHWILKMQSDVVFGV
ncbi:ankyrin repeat domain-containing protein 35 [Pelodytes ibericus]